MIGRSMPNVSSSDMQPAYHVVLRVQEHCRKRSVELEVPRPGSVRNAAKNTVNPTADIVIVGAGLAGLACALALRGSGLRVEVFEADAALGGRARSWTDTHTGDAIDLGPHIIPSEHRNMLALLSMLGTQQ